jgi:hypothetical protein
MPMRLLCLSLLAALGFACGSTPPPAAPREPPTVLPVAVSPIKAPELAESWREARAVLDRRCVVCHGCYDAPCQLILGSFDGIERGGSKQEVYDASRLRAADTTRLFIDASGAAWRNKGFHAVLPEASRDPRASLLAAMLELKRKNPLPVGGNLPEGFDLGLDREQQCPNPEEFAEFAEEHPQWGMPYALPAIAQEEEASLLRWLDDGAPREVEAPLAEGVGAAIARWEGFFNQDSNKARLFARYAYEHLFLASLYLEGLDERTFFRLVRSRTPPGQVVEEIATRRPFDSPGDGPFYYRLRRQTATVLDKTHMPYALGEARMKRWQELFFTPDYEVKALPSYDQEIAANPFRAFRALPVNARYRFMLDEAQYTLMGFIKGPVCRGQVALDVIQDRFWVTFVEPDLPIPEAEFLAEVSDHLDLPAEDGSNANLAQWLSYARNHEKFLQAKSDFLARQARRGVKVTLDAVWDGEGKNPNAALTVFRHNDSATVVRGLVGDHPKTAWVISYSVLERIHYLLVAGFDVFGNVGHQLNTRLYMDFLRMESEHNFLALLPRTRRRALVEDWYRDVRGRVKDQVYGKVARFDADTAIAYTTRDPEHELYELLRKHLAPVDERRYACPARLASVRDALAPLLAAASSVGARFPEVTFIELREASGDSYLTLLRDSAYTNVAHLFRADARRVPAEDQLVLVPGFLGAYPNLFVSVRREELDELVALALAARDDAGFAAFCGRFCVRRTDPGFWAFSDRVHAASARAQPLEAGLFDYNRLEDR